MERKPVERERLGCCAQLVVLGHLLKRLPAPLTIAGIASILPFCKTSVASAFHELEYFGLGNMDAMPKGKEKFFRFDEEGRDLWNSAQDRLFNPCKRTVGVAALPSNVHAVIAGADALAGVSALNELPPSVFAMELAAFRKLKIEVLSRNLAEMQLQLWAYDPCVFGKNKIDLLFLALSLKDNYEDRIQIAMESAMEVFPW